MKDIIVQKFTVSKQFVQKHKTGFAVGATTLTGLALLRNQHRIFNDFLETEDLNAKFQDWLVDSGA